MENKHPIGIFDSGYGGLSVMKEIQRELPQYDYIYLGDNARTPYGTRSFDIVYEYTREAVFKLFEMGCELVILACNTASAKALRTIQQNDLPRLAPDKRVLGVIRPSVEEVIEITKNKHVGVLGTNGTVSSKSYVLELQKTGESGLKVSQEACPMWVPIVENNEIGNTGSDYFVKKNINRLLKKDPQIDTIILGCTHYPLLMKSIIKFLPAHVNVLDQGPIVAKKLKDYLNRHPEIDTKCSKNSNCSFYTTELNGSFEEKASIFIGEKIKAKHLQF